jgi:hypothetical protein
MQRGIAALTVALIIVVVATVVTVGVMQISVGEQRNRANEARNKQSSTVADYALNLGAGYLAQNIRKVRSASPGGWMAPGAVKWTPCAASIITPPCGDGDVNLFDANWTAYANVDVYPPDATFLSTLGSYRFHYVARAAAPGSAMPGNTTVYILAEGQSRDLGGRSLLRRAFTLVPLIGRAPDAPLVAAAGANITGTMSVVGNPNGGGPGVPLSVWSGGDTDVAAGGSAQTCHVAEYLSTNAADGVDTDGSGYQLVRCPDCKCPNSPELQLSGPSVGEGIDILDRDSNSEGANPDTTNFPADLFEYTFGVASAEYEILKSKAVVLPNCANLGPSSEGLYWITGNCQIDANTVVGSLETPVAIVVENAQFRMNANSELLGLIFLFAHDGGNVSVQINGGPTLYGALLSNQSVDFGGGNYNARYEGKVLNNLRNTTPELTEVAGSWKDYR